MRESFTYGTVGRAPGNRCLYPEPDRKSRDVFRITVILCKTLHLPILSLAFPAGDFSDKRRFAPLIGPQDATPLS